MGNSESNVLSPKHYKGRRGGKSNSGFARKSRSDNGEEEGDRSDQCLEKKKDSREMYNESSPVNISRVKTGDDDDDDDSNITKDVEDEDVGGKTSIALPLRLAPRLRTQSNSSSATAPDRDIEIDSTTVETRTRRSQSLAPWSSSSSMTGLISRNLRKTKRSASQRFLQAPSVHLTHRITGLKHNKSTESKPDHVQAMFAAWNTAMVTSSSPKRRVKKKPGATPSPAPSSTAKLTTGEDAGKAAVTLDVSARDRLLKIAERAEAEEFCILLRHGTKDGKTPGVHVRDMSRSFWTYPNVFSTHEAITWLLENTEELKTRSQCVKILERINQMRLILAAAGSHHVKDKRQFWRFNSKRLALTGEDLRRNSKVTLVKDEKSKSKAKFRPLQSLSSVFQNRSKSKAHAHDDLGDDDDDDDDDDDGDEYDDWSDEDDDAYYNPDGAAEDWDMCDPDERSRNIFVAEVTKRKYNQKIINYEEMCHMLKLIGVRPPPMSVNDKVERSTRQKYKDGIITYVECCHLLRMIGVKDFPEPKNESDRVAAEAAAKVDKQKPLVEEKKDRTTSSAPAASTKTTDVSRPVLSSLETGDFIGGVGLGVGVATPTQKRKDGDDGTDDDLEDLGECSEGSDSDDDLGDLEGLTDDWDDGLVASASGDSLLKTVSIMSSQHLSSTTAHSSSTGSIGTASGDAEESGARRWIAQVSDADLEKAALRFLSNYESEPCLELLIHIAKSANIVDSVFSQFLHAFERDDIETKGQMIVTSGTSLSFWYLVLKGNVVVKESSTEVKLYEGNCFGSPALINGRNGGRSLFGRGGGGGISVFAGHSCVLAKMRRDKFISFLRQHEGLSAFFTSHVESIMEQRKKRQTYQKARRASLNLARVREVRGISEKAKTTRKAKLTRTSSGHRMVNRYKILTRLGRGSYGDVRKCEDTTTGQIFACKIVNRSQLRGGGGRSAADSSQFDQLELEVKILREMRHPNVVLLQEVIDDQALGKLYIIQEFVNKGPVMPEELFTKPLDPKRAWRLFRDMLRGLEYLHQHLIIHRDLKPSNILIDKEDNAKIADFGMAASLKKGDDLADAETAGSPAFMAPEVCGVMGNEPYSGQVADMWSAGATLYAMLFGHPPFIEPNLTLLEQFEGKLKPLPFPAKPEGLTYAEWPHCQALLRQMLDKSWRKRLRLKQCKEHEYTTMEGTTKLHQLEYSYTEPV
eukprot:g1670.t1